MEADCTLLYFKPSGKWKYEGRGLFPAGDVTRETIMAANGSMPGIISDASGMIVVVIPDDGCVTGFSYPRMLHPTEVS
jgi:hypothetical protein